MELFRELSSEEEKEFRQWSRSNYKPFDDIRGIWHPIVQDECIKMNEEAGRRFAADISYEERAMRANAD